MKVARVGSAAAAGLFLLATLEIWQLVRSRSEASLLLYASLGVCLLGFATAAALALAPARRWRAPLNTIRRWLERVEAAEARQSRPAGIALMAAAIAFWAVVQAALLSLPRTPEGNDQGAYLHTAQEVHASGGIRVLLRQLFTGEFAEANRHPLYIALLSLRPTFEAGTVLSLTIGGLTLLVLSILVARAFGPMVGGVFAILLATNFAFGYASSLVTCEGLLVLWTGLVWLTVAGRPRQSGTQADSSAGASTSGQAAAESASEDAIAGSLLGLAWLTKGTGLLLLAGFVAWKLIVHCRSTRVPADRIRNRRLGRLFASVAVLLLAWTIVASPLLVRNIQRFGNPFYNLNSYLLFTDEYVDLEQLAREMPLEEARSRYFKTHSAGDMIERELRGLAWETFIICRTLGPAPLDDSRALFGVPLLLLALIGMLVQRPRDALLLVIWLGLFLVLFAWYVPIAAGDRFVLPVAVPVLAYAAVGGVRCLALCASADRRFGTGVLASALLWGALWSAVTWVRLTPLAS